MNLRTKKYLFILIAIIGGLNIISTSILLLAPLFDWSYDQKIENVVLISDIPILEDLKSDEIEIIKIDKRDDKYIATLEVRDFNFEIPVFKVDNRNFFIDIAEIVRILKKEKQLPETIKIKE